MLSFLLTLALTSQNPGTVCVIQKTTDLVVPGKVNWVLGDPTFRVPGGTRAIIVRVNPERVQGVAEVKVYDGTSRLGWIEADGLSLVTLASSRSASPSPVKRATQAPPSVVVALNSASETKSYGIKIDGSKRPKRKRRLADFTEVDMAMAMMFQQMMTPPIPYSMGSRQSGLYIGPSRPSGTYIGGQGSSHKGGTYSNPNTGNHYQKRTFP